MKQQKLKIISCNVFWRELCHYASLSRNAFAFHFLDWGLHCKPDQLRNEVQQAIDDTDDGFDAVLLGYGLCSKGLDGIKAGKCRLVIPRGHDCITVFLGSKERYREYFSANPGTYWYTPGWIENHLSPGQERYEKNYSTYLAQYGEDNARYLMDMEQGWFKKYTAAAYTDLGIGDTGAYEEYTKECANWLKWKYDRVKSDATLIRNFVNGDWRHEAFLVVEPGSMIKATDDEMIMTSVKTDPS